MKQVKISDKLKGLATVSFQDLKEKFERNKLKASQNREVGGLKTSIVEKGFFAPL